MVSLNETVLLMAAICGKASSLILWIVLFIVLSLVLSSSVMFITLAMASSSLEVSISFPVGARGLAMAVIALVNGLPWMGTYLPLSCLDSNSFLTRLKLSGE